MSDINTYNRFLRQIDILKPEVCKEKIYIIGAGATGSYSALSLAKMGFNNIIVFDGDKIEEHNFPNQLFPIKTKGQNKAEALGQIIKEYTDVRIGVNPIFYENQPVEGIVVSALDTMKGRKQIYKNCCEKKKVKLLLDPRTGPTVFRLFTVEMSLEGERREYEKTLYSDEEADEAPCTGRSIIYNVLLVAAYICKQIKLYQMNEEYKKDIIVDLKNDMILTK